MLLKVYKTVYEGKGKPLETLGRTVLQLPEGEFKVKARNGVYIAKSELIIDDRGKGENYGRVRRQGDLS